MKNKLILTTVLFLLIGMAVLSAQDIDTVWTRQTSGDILSVSFHSSSQFFVTGNNKWYAGIWDVNTGNETKKYTGYPGGNVFFSKTGKYLVQASRTGFQVHDFTNDSLILTKDGYSQYSNLFLSISSNEKYIAVESENKLTIWSLETKEKIKEIDTLITNDQQDKLSIGNIEFSPDGTYIVYSIGESNLGTCFLKFFNLSSDSVDFQYPIGAYYTFKYSNDGTKIAFTSADNGEAVKIMDINTKQILTTISGISQAVHQICFSLDDKYLVYTNNNINVYNIENRKVSYLYDYGATFENISISNDNKYFVTGIGPYLYLLNAHFEISSVSDPKDIINATIVYPNPANNNIINLNFDLKVTNLTIINIYDINGQIIKQIENKYLPFGSYEFSIDLSNLSNGSYYLKISSGSYNYSQALIVCR